jgi:methionyl-tRNA formyltransferase
MKQRVAILCSDPLHPVHPWLERWATAVAGRADVCVHRSVTEVDTGDFLFLVSCHELIRADVRSRFRYTLVLHASDLPSGRGMSPHVWQILAGANTVVMTLLNAEDAVDTGDIWQQIPVTFNGTELYDEIHARLFDAELALMGWALEHCDAGRPRPQAGPASYFRRRVPGDSAIDPARPIAEVFDLLRVADPDRYPAYFELRGRRYRIRIDRM